MSPLPDHRIVPAEARSAPRPFRAFAVRSDEARHAWYARAPYGRVHVVRTRFLDPAALSSLAAEGHARIGPTTFAEVDYAATTIAELEAAAPDIPDLVGAIASAVHATGILGTELAACRELVAARIDYLGTCGAGFHNDVGGHWTGCLFWILALEADDVEFVMPHAGVRLALAPGDLVVFDQTMAHGLCRPRDDGQAVAASFASGDSCRQMFLTGELPLPDARWAALGAPWLAVEEHERRGAVDLLVAEFDERSGVIKRLRALADCMSRRVCHADPPVG